MKKSAFLLFAILTAGTLWSYEVYKGNIYPGAVNHINSAYSCGLFSLNTMESSYREINVKLTPAFNNVETEYKYGYDSEGRLISFQENNDKYIYEFKNRELGSVRFNDKEIYFPTPYFVAVRKGGDELNFDLEKDDSGNIRTITLNDENGTRYFFSDGRLTAVESIGTGDDGFASRLDYNEEMQLIRYRKETSEGRGESKIKTLYSFTYDGDRVTDYLYEKSGPGQFFERTHCTFEYIDGADGSIETAFAIDDNGNIHATAQYEYTGANEYTIKITDERNRLLETVEVSKR
ncbi:hypothetical protein [Spirochaeta isovalerica]|uniref:Uncharacterized protein n=1 Tax=Spirochaeta isovalerica TaxID=150 RepID=A0A841RAU5_9SPIO|nr:hypothetical protein [Spirochaeta isovalerica]MBB6479552.1 hypothetical protein [Spirochaeta isovalerica]